MTDIRQKRRKFSLEILSLIAVCFTISLILYLFIAHLGVRIIEEYCFYQDIILSEDELYQLDTTMFGVGFAAASVFFSVLFLTLFGEKLAYIRTIIDGIHALQSGEFGKQVILIGNNELTQLAEAVNYLSESEQKIKEKEKKLSEEKEELIRTLSHDIRTPLTSIMSYTELLQSKEILTQEEQKEYLLLVSKKTSQIKELTDILLDGGRREVEYFEDARLLFEQLAAEFEEELEENYKIILSGLPLPKFSGNFDVSEMRRLFDNLISNIQKYAEPSVPITLLISKQETGMEIRQKNGIRKDKKTSAPSYRMGINSLRRIAHNYGGTVEVSETEQYFEITVTLSDI